MSPKTVEFEPGRHGSGPAQASPANAADLDQARERVLVERMRGGDEAAVREFCQAHLPSLYRFALVRVDTAEDADDVVQIVLSIAARRISTFRGESSLRAWLLAICRREAGRYAAAAARRRAVFDVERGQEALKDLEAPEDLAPESISSERQKARSVQATLSRLPERYAEVLTLKYMEGCSSKEIAALCQISDEAVQSLLARARKMFREVCDDDLRDQMRSGDGTR